MTKPGKRFGPRQKSRAWMRRRAQVERLEDRVLLSADPMLAEVRANPSLPLSADNISLTPSDRTASWPGLDAIATNMLVVDLTRGVEQNNSKLTAGSTPGELLLPGQADCLDLDVECRSAQIDRIDGEPVDPP